MRILHVNGARDFRGGERQTLLLAAGLHRTGADVHVALAPGSELAARFRAEGVPDGRIHEVRMRGEVDPMAIVRLAKLCRAHRIDVLHLHTAHAHALGVAAALLAPNVRTVVSRRVDYARSSGFLSALKYRRADAFIAISQAVASILLADGVRPERIHLVRSGIRIAPPEEVAALRARRPELRRAHGVDAAAKVVLNVGNLVGHKGQGILPEAARILPPEVRILIAGEGPLRAELEAAIAKLGVGDRVTLLGHCHDLPPLYALADVYVQPSTSEGLGTAMLDAMAFGLPVVASMAGGIPEAVRDGETGLLLSGRNPYLLGEAVKRLCRDEALAAALGAEGRRVAEQEFSAERMVRETMEVYGKVMQCQANG